MPGCACAGAYQGARIGRTSRPRWNTGTIRAPARRIMVRPDAEGSSTRGDQWRRKPLRRSGDHELRRGLEGSGTTAVEPGRRSSSFLKDAELSISYSSEFETVEHRGREAARGAATRLSLPLERAR
jgi:hypothetical protein